MVGWVDYFTVHPDIYLLSPEADTTNGIVSVTALYSMPFVLIQPLEIVGIDDGVFSLCKRYPSERIAVAQPVI